MRALVLGCLCLGAPFAAAAEDEYDLSGMIEPGLWETTTQQVSADGEAGAAETDRDCVTEEDLQDFSNLVRGDDDQRVTMEAFDRGDDYVSYRMRFASDDPNADATGTMSGRMEFDGPERYQGTMSFSMSLQGRTFESTTRVDGRRIGECSDDDGEYQDDYSGE